LTSGVSGGYHDFEKLSALVTADMGTSTTGATICKETGCAHIGDEHPDRRNWLIAAAQGGN